MKNKYFITVPYPYTSGALHIGHGRTYVSADIISRFKKKLGFNVLFPIAYHVSGMPIMALCDDLKKGDEKTKKMILEYIYNYEKDSSVLDSILKRIEDPKEFAKYFSSKFAQDFKRMDLSIDFSREFTTMDPYYNDFIEWQFLKLKEKGFIKKEDYPVLFDPIENNAVGEDDIKDGDSNPVQKTEYTSILFKLEDKDFIDDKRDVYLIASTLRPETISGITNLWINKDEEYVAFEVLDSIYITSKLAYEKMKYQIDTKKVLKTFKADLLIEKYVSFLGKKYPIYDAKFVYSNIGTGIVYSVPAHAPYDYLGLVDAKNRFDSAKDIELISIIDLKGYSKYPAIDALERVGVKTIDQRDLILDATKLLYKDEFYLGVINNGKYKGQLIKDFKDKFISDLIEDKLAFIFYDTSRDAYTRGNNKVFVSLLKDQWFIDYSNVDLKDKARKHIESMEIIPKKYRLSLNNAIDWVEKRPCARKRGLGTKLPFDTDWVIESLSDSTIYMAFYTIADRLIPIYNKNLQNDSNYKLDSSFFDYMFNSKGNIEEVSSKNNISINDIEDMKKSFEYWYGVDLRHTAPAHISNHLIFYILNHIMLFDEKYWPKAQSFNEMLIREGQKMSKSKGNIISIRDVIDNYGIDLYRLYVASNSELDSVVDWKESEVLGLQKRLNNFTNLIENSKKEDIGYIEEEFIKKINNLFVESYKSYVDYKFRDAVVFGMFNVMQEIKEYEKFANKKPDGLVYAILKDWLKLLEPIMPSLCEKYWNMFDFKEDISTSIIENHTLKDEDNLNYIYDLIKDLKKLLEINSGDKIYLYTASYWMYFGILNIDLPINQFIDLISSKYDVDKKDISSFYLKIKKIPGYKYSPIDEKNILKMFKEYLENYLGKELYIDDSYDPQNKKVFSLPKRPAIYIQRSF